MIKIEDAEREIIREWDFWAAEHTGALSSRDGMLFFNYLQREKPGLLEFRCSGNKWQRVHGWLRYHGRVKE